MVHMEQTCPDMSISAADPAPWLLLYEWHEVRLHSVLQTEEMYHNARSLKLKQNNESESQFYSST